MPQLKITARARTDLYEIVKYIAKDNPANAEKFAIKILEKCKLIASKPMMGRPREEFGPGLRSALCRPYLILFHILSDTTEILYIVHGSQDVRRIIGS